MISFLDANSHTVRRLGEQCERLGWLGRAISQSMADSYSRNWPPETVGIYREGRATTIPYSGAWREFRAGIDRLGPIVERLRPAGADSALLHYQLSSLSLTLRGGPELRAIETILEGLPPSDTFRIPGGFLEAGQQLSCFSDSIGDHGEDIVETALDVEKAYWKRARNRTILFAAGTILITGLISLLAGRNRAGD